jgi:hypothetical protein
MGRPRRDDGKILMGFPQKAAISNPAGRHLTSADATSCKIRATSAFGVAPNRLESAMTATATTTTDLANVPHPAGGREDLQHH